jgi:ABC-type multidrug transport system fused ATPase/permease subunit
VILDEPTAALDARAEAQLFEAIRTLLGGRSVLLISHRFSSVRRPTASTCCTTAGSQRPAPTAT